MLRTSDTTAHGSQNNVVILADSMSGAVDLQPNPRGDRAAPASARDMLALAVLRCAVVCVLLGRGALLLRGQSSLSALLYSPGLTKPVFEAVGVSWEGTMLTVAGAEALGVANRLAGGMLWAVAAAILMPRPSPRLQRWRRAGLAAATVVLAVLALGALVDRNGQVAQLLEFGIQVAAPMLLLQAEAGHGRATTLARGAIAATFLGHGLYALGVFPVPGHFVSMVISCLGVTEVVARQLLAVAGVLDVVVAAGVVVGGQAPGTALDRVVDRPVLAYAAAWGLLTALARVVAHFRWDMAVDRLVRWTPETIVRLPHALLPAVLLLLSVAVLRLPAPPPLHPVQSP